MSILRRYAKINEKIPREFCLLQGSGCKWKKCTFCDYFHDVGENPFEINKTVLAEVTGEYGVLDIINSGSCTELDEKTIALIKQTAKDKNIHTLWFEAHYMYRNALTDFAEQFTGINVKFRTGIETFDVNQRGMWQKGVDAEVSAADVAKFFNGVCLLFAVEGQSRESVSDDIKSALEHFEYFSINAFVENTTDLKRDDAMVEWFIHEWYDKLKDDDRAEVLLNNTDLGVG